MSLAKFQDLVLTLKALRPEGTTEVNRFVKRVFEID